MKAKKLLLLILFAFFAGTILAGTVEETFKKRIPCTEPKLLTVKNSNGSVKLSSWDAAEVEIVAYKKVRTRSGESAEKLLEKIEIDIEESSHEIFVETIFPRKYTGSGGIFEWLFGPGGGSFSVEYEIKIPQKMDLNIESTNGSIIAADVVGRIRLETTNGKINAENVSGAVRSKTTNGSITVRFENTVENEDMFFKSTNGSIRLYLPEKFGAQVDLKTTNGSIKTDFPLSIRGGSSYNKSEFYGKINDGNNSLSCKTTNGSIYLLYND